MSLANIQALMHIEPGQLATLDDVIAAYRAILLREPDAGGLKYFEQKLAKGLPKRELIEALATSPELDALPDESHKARVRTAYRIFAEEIAGTSDAIDWFHSMALPDDVITHGMRRHDVLQREADCIFKPDVTGRSVLDIGAWDGFFSFEAERRGAREILATDHYCWSGPGWGTKAGFDFAHDAFCSKASSLDIDLFSLNPEELGTFDVVLFLGVFYHLKDPYGGLERAAAMCDDLLVVETATACNYLSEPVLRHYRDDSLLDDPTNFFLPNTACLESMLREMGSSPSRSRSIPACPSTKIVRRRRAASTMATAISSTPGAGLAEPSGSVSRRDLPAGWSNSLTWTVTVLSGSRSDIFHAGPPS